MFTYRLGKIISDQQESGIIESIFDGIVRLTGLESIFYSELLFSINFSYDINNLDTSMASTITEESEEELEEIIESESEDNINTIFARMAHDILLPFILLNNKEFFSFFINNTYEDLLNLDSKQISNDELTGINSLIENFVRYNEIFNDAALKTSEISTAINFDILNNVQDIFDETELSSDLEALTENLTDEAYNNQSEFLIDYVTVIYPILANIINSTETISDKKTFLSAVKNYFYSLIENSFNDENINLHEDDFSAIEFDNNDELNVEFNDNIATINKEDEDTSARSLMLVMGLERESIQAPMLTQTTQLYEGDLAWRTSQELEIYCSIEALGRISDIFLNSLE